MLSKLKQAPLVIGLLLACLLNFGWILFSKEQIGNDYQAYQVSQAMNLRYFQAVGVEPQWTAFITGGIPIHGFALTQAFYLPGWLTTHLPGYWDGRALDWFTLRYLILALLAQFLFYRVIRDFFASSRTSAFLISFATFYQLRTLDSLRFGHSMDATVLSYSILGLSLYFFRKPKPILALAVSALCYLLFTASYPVLMPFALIGGLIVLLAFVQQKKTPLSLQFTRGARLLLAMILGLFAAAPNWVPFTEWLQVNAHRVKAPSLEWASFVPMGGHSLRANIWFPWAAEVHSGFAGSSLLILLLGTLSILSLFYLKKTWPFLLGLALPFLYAFGSRSPLYLFFFHFIPGFASIRVPGRIFFLLPLVALALALVLLNEAKKTPEIFSKRLRYAALGAALVVALGTLATILSLAFLETPSFGSSVQELTPERLNSFWSLETKIIWLSLALISCSGFLGALWSRNKSKICQIALGLATFIQVSMLMNYGTWRSPRTDTPTLAQFESANKLPLQGEAPIVAGNELYESTFGTATIAYTSFIKNVGSKAACFLPVEINTKDAPLELPFYFPGKIICAKNQIEAFAMMSQISCRADDEPTSVVIDPENCANVAKLNPSSNQQNMDNRLLTLTPNRTVLSVSTSLDSYFVSPFPAATSNWSVRVNDQLVRPILINGAFIGTFIKAGQHRIEIAYFSPWIILSFRIAFTALALILFLFLYEKTSMKKATILSLLIFVIGLPLYMGFERNYSQSVRKDLVLKNDYADRLERQLKQWKKKP